MLRSVGEPLPGEPSPRLPAGPLLIVGASARAACESARRRGREPMAIDLYGDIDLAGIVSRSIRLPAREFPHGIVARARDLPPSPFVYTGGLENHPRIIEALERERPGEGSPAAALARVRDPFVLASVLRKHGIPAPRVAASPRGRRDIRWLSKPRRGCGGRGIRMVQEDGHRVRPGGPPDRYYQEHVRGPSYSAVFDAGESGDPRLLGMTRQLVGLREGSPFQYCGSVTLSPEGGRDPAARWCREFLAVGSVLAREFGLRGIFGVDAVFDGRDLRPVEVNPRYPASLEIIERAEELRASSGLELRLAKRILFAPRALVFPGLSLAGPDSDGDLSRRFPGISAFRDLPAAGEVIEAGGPILTCVSAPWSSGQEQGDHGLPPRFLADLEALLSWILARARRRENEPTRAVLPAMES